MVLPLRIQCRVVHKDLGLAFFVPALAERLKLTLNSQHIAALNTPFRILSVSVTLRELEVEACWPARALSRGCPPLSRVVSHFYFSFTYSFVRTKHSTLFFSAPDIRQRVSGGIAPPSGLTQQTTSHHITVSTTRLPVEQLASEYRR